MKTQTVKEVNKTVEHLEVDIDPVKRTKLRENVAPTGPSEVSLTQQNTRESVTEDKREEKDLLIKENAKSKKFMAQSI